MNKIIIVIIILIALGIGGYFAYEYLIKKDNNESNSENTTNQIEENTMNTTDSTNTTINTTSDAQNPIATMEVEGYGTMKIELYPALAPNTVANFITLANNGFYDGLTFHRIMKDFMIQGGDPKGDGTGSPSLSDIDKTIKKGSAEDKEYSIVGEMSANNYPNNLKHEKGVISMARADYTQISKDLAKDSYNSGGSQFFIMTADAPSLNGLYAAFGKVTEGLDVLDKIANADVKNVNGELSTPVNPPVIKSVRVETFGKDYGMPQTIDKFDIQKWMGNQST